MKPYGWLLFIVACFVACFGCRDVAQDGVEVREQRWQQQKCEMCGSEWLVMPHDRSKVVPSTVEWCFRDGQYCETGLAMIVERETNGTSIDLRRRWLIHCFACDGCRCAAFTPEEWREVVDAIEEWSKRNRRNAHIL